MNLSEENMQNAKLAADMAGRAGQTMGMGVNQCKEASTRERLLNQLNRASEDQGKISYALRILEAHPEFEDFLWLVRSGVL